MSIGRTFPWAGQGGSPQGPKAYSPTAWHPRDLAFRCQEPRPPSLTSGFSCRWVSCFGPSAHRLARCKKPVSVGDGPRGSYIYIKAISGDCLPPNPVMGTEIEISPWIKPVEIRVFVMEACVQCCGVVEAQRQERLGKEEPRGPAQGQECQNSQEIRSLSALQSQRCNPSKMPRKNLLLSQHRFLPLASQLSKGHGRRLIVARPSIGLCPHRDLPPFHRPVATGSAPSERAAVQLSHQGPCFMPWLTAARA